MKVKTGIVVNMRTGERLGPTMERGSRGPGLLAFLMVALVGALLAYCSTLLP